MDSPDPYLPDIVMECSMVPVQWFGRNNHRGDPYYGEKRMWFASFEQALDDYRQVEHGVGWKSQRLREARRYQAVEWVESDAEGFLTFNWYCEVFELDPARVRKRLAQGAVSPVIRTSNKGPVAPLTMKVRRRWKKKAVA
jgi:hypothetical protein